MSPLTQQIGFLGAGNMGEALIKGILKADLCLPDQLRAADPSADRRMLMEQTYGVRTMTDNRDLVRASDVILLAVKPQVMPAVLEEIRPEAKPSKLFISIAAGIPLRTIAKGLGSDRVIRVMPNTPALVLEGASALAGATGATQADLDLALQIFSAVGRALVLEEQHLDAVTGLSGSGPAYIFLILEALADAGVKMGLPRHVAITLAAQTVLGSARMVLETGKHPGQLKDQVASPAGTTIAGLHRLEEGKLRATLMNAVEAATLRSRELGKENP